MNSLMKMIALVFFTVCISANSFAGNNNIDRTTQKAREAVENASPDDWYTLATSAKKCLEKGVNMKEAAAWLEQSLCIRETPFNLKLKGDYYVYNRLPEQALEYYSKSIRVGKLSDPDYMDAEAQEKIVKLVHQLK